MTQLLVVFAMAAVLASGLAGAGEEEVNNGQDPTKPLTRFDFPLVNIALPDLWFVNLYPSSDIRYNFGSKRAGDDGRWFFPFNFMVGKMVTRSVVGSVEVGIPIIDDYKVYDFKLEARLGFFF